MPSDTDCQTPVSHQPSPNEAGSLNPECHEVLLRFDNILEPNQGYPSLGIFVQECSRMQFGYPTVSRILQRPGSYPRKSRRTADC